MRTYNSLRALTRLSPPSFRRSSSFPRNSFRPRRRSSAAPPSPLKRSSLRGDSRGVAAASKIARKERKFQLPLPKEGKGDYDREIAPSVGAHLPQAGERGGGAFKLDRQSRKDARAQMRWDSRVNDAS